MRVWVEWGKHAETGAPIIVAVTHITTDGEAWLDFYPEHVTVHDIPAPGEDHSGEGNKMGGDHDRDVDSKTEL